MSSVTSYDYPRVDDAWKAYYIRLAQDESARELVRELVVPRISGRALIVEKDQILRVTCTEGKQVADFNAWNKDDPKETFWSGRTRLLQRAHLSVGDRLCEAAKLWLAGVAGLEPNAQICTSASRR